MLGKDGPEFELIQDPNKYKILVFTGEAVWEIDQFGTTETTANNLYDKNGSVFCTEAGWTMNVQNTQPGGYWHRKSLNMTDCLLTEHKEQLNNIMIYGSWSIYLQDVDRPETSRIRITSFETSNPKAGL